MSKELEKIKATVRDVTDGMAENAKIELLDALAWWACEEAGSLNYDSPDMYDEEE
ncbi:MAG: hypothetical protein HDS56_03130 [Barnesiella sp.]|nr:hypothetical protein [Barnesiella sp.]MBD5344255.1 hypothetical protein [Bacteroides sp.]